ncbi:MAG TPA: hypothetical protein VFR45_00390 [Nocardioides sp.]|nr:hypothetical protein [Nocardioides sp.]
MTRFGDVEELFCSSGDCLEDAVVHGQVTLGVGMGVGTLAGAGPGQERHTFNLPLCGEHARLLGYGTTVVAFSNGLPEEADGR